MNKFSLIRKDDCWQIEVYSDNHTKSYYETNDTVLISHLFDPKYSADKKKAEKFIIKEIHNEHKSITMQEL